MRKNYQRKARKSNHKFEVVGGQELLVRVPLPMAEVWGPAGNFSDRRKWVSKDCYIKDIQFGESPLPDQILHLKRDVSGDLKITISSKGARLKGIVVNDESLPVAGVWVVAVPEENKKSVRHLSKAVTTDQYGRYDLRGLAPEKYLIFAWDGVERGEWEDPEFLKTNEAKAAAFEVSDSDTKSVDLQLIKLQRQNEAAQDLPVEKH